MVEELPLPKGCWKTHAPQDRLRRPLLEAPTKPDSDFDCSLAEEVDVVRHDDETADCPSVTATRTRPLGAQDGKRIGIGEKRATVGDADSDEIDRGRDRDRVETLEMLSSAHDLFVSETWRSRRLRKYCDL